MKIDIEDVIDKIIKQTKKPKKEILKRIETKKEDLGGLITDEGAACIVAKELGVEIFEEEIYQRKKVQIKDLTIGMNTLSITGLVDSINPTYEFTRKNGQKGKLAKFLLIDSTGQIQVILWNEHTKLVSDGTLKEKAIIEIKNAYIKESLNNQLELHVGRQGKIAINPDNVDSSEFEDLSQEIPLIKINQLKERMYNVHLIGKIQWKSQINSFSKENGTGQVSSLNIFDETGQTRVALWDSHASFVDKINLNDIVRIYDAYTRSGRDDGIELHLGRNSEIKKEKSIQIDLPDTAPSTQSISTPTEVKIKNLLDQQKNIKVTGKILEKAEVREVVFKDNSIHHVCDVLFADETGCITLSVWDADIENVEPGKTYIVENGYITVFRDSPQLNVGKFGSLKKSDLSIKNINREHNLSEGSPEINRKYIIDIGENEQVEILGTIVSLQERNPIYDSCPNCSKKVTPTSNGAWICKKCGEIPEAIPRMLWAFTLDDGTDNIRITVIDTVAEAVLGMSTNDAKKMIEEQLLENIPLMSKTEELLGKKILLRGKIRYSSFTSKLEMIADSVSDPNSREELSKILARVESYI